MNFKKDYLDIAQFAVERAKKAGGAAATARRAASGDFSIPSAGFMIEKGRKAFPVQGVTIGGNLFELLKAVDKVGSDLTWFQSFGSPTVAVSHVKLGGA